MGTLWIGDRRKCERRRADKSTYKNNDYFGERPGQDDTHRLLLFWVYIGTNEDLMMDRQIYDAFLRFGPDVYGYQHTSRPL